VLSPRIAGMRLVLRIAVLTAVALSAVPAAMAGGEPSLTPVRVERTMRLPEGVARGVFRFRVRASFADRVRLVVPTGAVVSVLARSVDGRMGIGVSTAPDLCRRHGRLVVCEQAQEWCPLTDSRWRVTVRKNSRAPAEVRVRFVFVRRTNR